MVQSSKNRSSLLNVILFSSVFLFVLFWQELHIPIEDSTFCFMDAVLWVDALEGFYYQNDLIVQKLDRPPLSLWMGAWLKHLGFSSTQALQGVARLGLAGVFATLFLFFFRTYSLFTACICILFLSRASSFVRLSVWLNAQMICNFFFALHMCYGYHIVTSKKQSHDWKMLILGFFGGAAIAAKEQGIILVLMTVPYLLVQPFFTNQIISGINRILYYIIGCLPMVGWYLYWLKDQLIHGEKWRIFQSDLSILSEQSSFSELMRIKTTWGSFSSRFGEQFGVFEFLNQSSRILMRDLYTPFICIFPLAGVIFICLICHSRMRIVSNFKGFFWFLLHIITVVPLLLVPIFEPYHYSIAMVGCIGMFGWSLFHFQKMSLLAIPLILWGTNVSLDNWGVRYTRSLELELQSCISNRIRPVREWARSQLSSQSVLFFTDSLVKLDTLQYPQWISIYPMLQKCKENYYVVSSGLANQNHLFEQDLKQQPTRWTKVKEIDAINKELWFVYQMNCDE